MSERIGVFKTTNEYMRQIDRGVYERTPKAVFAAIAASWIINHEHDETADYLTTAILDEWQALYAAGIVPQKPPKR
jgi:hypothetical protein